MVGGDLLVQFLGQHVDLTLLVFVAVSVSPKFDLSKNLVGERTGHDKGWMSSGAAEIKKTSRGEHDDSMAIWELVAVYLVLDVFFLDSWIAFNTCNVNFIIKVANVSNNGVVFHLSHVFNHDNLIASSCSNENISGLDDT